MSHADEFVAFIDGLKLAIRQQIAPHVSTLAEAQIMTTKVDLHSGQGNRSIMGVGIGYGGQKQREGPCGDGRRGKLIRGHSLCPGGEEEVGRIAKEGQRSKEDVAETKEEKSRK